MVVGLGNPGVIYKDSRHNIGFAVVKAIAKVYKTTLKRDKDTFSLSAKIKIGQQGAILALPLTFMNLSGIAVSALLKKYKIDLKSLLVVCDDLDLEFARLKIRNRGSSGGHRGLQSIIDNLASQGFSRLRIGIGRPRKTIDSAEYVLSAFKKKEKEESKEILERAVDCAGVWVTEGVERAMNIFNQKELS